MKKYNKNGELIFYGEYLYCQKLKGKEYLDGNLIFEGEYLFNKKWEGKGYDKYGNLLFTLNKGNGKVKEYIEYNELHYVGEILNGRKNGKGKEYNDYGELIFEGEYLKGRKNGKGKEYNNYNDLIFEGEYLNGQRWNGKGKEYNNSNDLIFEGEYLNGKKKGIWKEYILNDNLFSKSELNNCIMDIDIESSFDEILQFEGEYLNGEKNGKGKEFRNGNIIFEGEYLNGKKNGKGKKYNENGNLIFKGEYYLDKKWKGKGFNKYGDVLYYINNSNENAKEYDDDGNLIFKGEYLNGERNGKGKEYNYLNGKLLFEGEYINGKRWNGIGKESNDDLENIEIEYLNGKKRVGNIYGYNEFDNLYYKRKYLFQQIMAKHMNKNYLKYKKLQKSLNLKEYNENGKEIFEGLCYIELKNKL